MTDRQPETADETLLARFASGDDRALGELAGRYEAYLVGLASGMLGHEDRARDAVQETWLRVIRHARGFRRQSSFKTWVYRILVNRCLDMKPTMLAPHLSQDPPHEPRHDDSAAALERAMQRLTQTQRTVLLLCYHRGLTHPQAAEVLGVPLGTLKSRLGAALESLRTIMNPGEPSA